MSETEEPPAKLHKTDHEDETVLTDTTEVSNLTDASDVPDTTEAGMPEVTDLPEVADMPEVTDKPEVTDMPEVTDTPEVTDMPDTLEMPEGVSMESTDMVEERLHDSLESQEAPESQEGQEEWLSEDVLTDDDFNPATESAPESQTSQPVNGQIETDSATASNTAEPEPKEQAITDPIPKETDAKPAEQNIEDALNTLEGGPEKETGLPDLDEFLIKKTDAKPVPVQPKQENVEPEPDDGNDTDDLLRMLGDDGSKTKKLTKTVKDIKSTTKKEPASSDDEDFVLQGASAKKTRLAMSMMKKPPKAEPEGGDGTDPSSDEAGTMKKMFTNKKKNQKFTKPDVKPVRYQETHAKSIVSVVDRPKKDRLATSTPLRPGRERSLLKAPRASAPEPGAPDLAVQVKRESHHHTYSRKKPQIITKAPAPPKTTSILKPAVKKEPPVEEDITNEEEFLDENFHMAEEEFESDYDDEMGRSHQRIMKPEHMDEDIPSDAETHSEDGSLYDSKQMEGDIPSADSGDGSLYDELPSSESEDAEDWFQLDIRAEKAGDYLPLLGPKAKEILLEEKKRVTARLANLKQSLSALTDSGKKQAEQVRTATMSLAELDDMLKAS